MALQLSQLFPCLGTDGFLMHLKNIPEIVYIGKQLCIIRYLYVYTYIEY